MVLENNIIEEENIGPTTSSLVNGILTKYNLNKSPEEEAKQILSGGDLPISIVVQTLSENFANNLISEKDFITSLTSKLNISNEMAENIVRDVFDKVVPYIKSLPKRKPIAPKQIPTIRTEPTEYNLNIEPIAQPEIVKKIPDFKPTPPKNITRPKGPDSYREPIE